jgi:FG-GAP-like repeat
VAQFFSLKGEIPAVGDFNGDGKDDIVTFVQKQQRYADGSPIGPAPVWVSLSNGSRFQTSRIWHADFARGQALPRVGDMNLDGRDDVLSFTRATVSGERARDVYAAASRGNRFGPEAIWHSDFVAKDELPFVTSLAGRTLSALTGDSDDDTPTADVIAFAKDGAVRSAESFSAVPYPSGAPWERYKWFTEKGLGVALYPEWLYRQGPDHCVARDHRFLLRGASGIGGGSVTASSVRLGGRAGHISQELGHSLFANCLDETDGDPDVFNLYEPVYQTPPTSGGIGANAMPGCPEEARWEAQEPSVAGYDCRDPEHYFLGLLEDYRLNGDEFRREIAATTDPARKARLRAQYLWIRLNWFRGTEFKRGPAIGSTLTLDGLQCLIGDCPLG